MHGNKKCPSFFLFLAKLTSMLYKNFVRENVVDDLFMGFKGKPLIFFYVNGFSETRNISFSIKIQYSTPLTFK